MPFKDISLTPLQSSQLLAIILFTVLTGIGLVGYDDYGISWDEHSQREIGLVSYNYLFHGDPTLETYHDRDYGVAFELPLIILEKILHLEDSRNIYLMRHLATHLFFLFCLWFAYWLIYHLFQNKWLAVAGVLMVLLHPRLYAHSFFNTKDIPFMGMYFIAFYLIYKCFKHHRLLHFALAGAVVACLVNLRIMGILLVVLVIGFLVLDFIRLRYTNNHNPYFPIKALLVFLLCFWSVLYLSWPYLYLDAAEKFVNAFLNMSRFRWKYEVLYLGEMIPATALPWHYPLVWFTSTTPLVYVILGVGGIIGAGLTFFRFPSKMLYENRNLLIYSISFVVPVAAVIILQSVLYDGWRHLYFIYPPFVLLVIWLLNKLSKRKAAPVVHIILGCTFLYAAWFMFTNHPHQQVFFNVLVNRNTPNHERLKFEADYWGVSYKQGLEAILNVDDSPTIDLEVANAPGRYNADILPAEHRSRLNFTSENPKYFITEYRWHPQEYDFRPEQEIFKVEVQNNTVLSVFQLRD